MSLYIGMDLLCQMYLLMAFDLLEQQLDFPLLLR